MTTEINIPSINKFAYVSINKNGGLDGAGTWEKIVDISAFKKAEYMLIAYTYEGPCTIYVSNDKLEWIVLESANLWTAPKVGIVDVSSYKWLKLYAKIIVANASNYSAGAVALFSGGGVVNRLLKKLLKHLRSEVCYGY